MPRHERGLLSSLHEDAKRKVTFVVGAGISKPSGLLDFKELSVRAIEPLMASMPDRDLLRPLTSRVRPEIILNALEAAFGKKALGVLDLLSGGEPNPNHLFLAAMLARGHTVVTVNLDTLIEAAAHQLGHPLDPVETTTQFKALLPTALAGQLLKVHGTIEDKHGWERYDSAKATLDALAEGLDEHRSTAVEAAISGRDVCFMGYGFRDDFTLNSVLQGVADATGTATWLNWDAGELREESSSNEALELLKAAEIERLYGSGGHEADTGLLEYIDFLLKRPSRHRMTGDSSAFIKEIEWPRLGVTTKRAAKPRPQAGHVKEFVAAVAAAPPAVRRYALAVILERDPIPDGASQAQALRIFQDIAQEGAGLDAVRRTDALRRAAELERVIKADGWLARANQLVAESLELSGAPADRVLMAARRANYARQSNSGQTAAALAAELKQHEEAAKSVEAGAVGTYWIVRGLLEYEIASREKTSFALALAHADVGVQLRKKARDLRGAASAHNLIGLALQAAKNPACVHVLSEARLTALKLGDRLVAFQASRNLGLWYEKNDLAAAKHAYRVALTNAALSCKPDSPNVIEALYRIVRIARLTNDLDLMKTYGPILLRRQRDRLAKNPTAATEIHQLARVMRELWESAPEPNALICELAALLSPDAGAFPGIKAMYARDGMRRKEIQSILHEALACIDPATNAPCRALLVGASANLA